MKKVLLPLLLVVLIVLSACSNPAPSPTGDSSLPASPTSNAPTSLSPESAGDAQSATAFERFENSLDDAGYSYETTTMAANLVGAHIGTKYKFDFGKVELYQLDENSEALSKAVEDGGLYMEGFGVFPCEFNGNLAMLIDVTENEDALLDLFNSL